ncbi:uncharacterized protein BDW43DRAFT_267000 [Aspergillus alliaceus]|uniref:uncharacterized protein n=1 Tax=Petromyces alliaceus TaxID=209559 RepID=UPI0012A6DDA8|nr:uncharacterized protein BDW43DRAFT_267000 [Aspergillus alliaceus]KAB8236465.1 hypothetical protein BDW43DRAFT_267000 [Aspergillus alliaceus]
MKQCLEHTRLALHLVFLHGYRATTYSSRFIYCRVTQSFVNLSVSPETYILPRLEPMLSIRRIEIAFLYSDLMV